MMEFPEAVQGMAQACFADAQFLKVLRKRCDRHAREPGFLAKKEGSFSLLASNFIIVVSFRRE
ncbi:MAG: hypothetical protein ACLUHE_14485 [Christensenellales bacterium]